jgi:hypothetical protein
MKKIKILFARLFIGFSSESTYFWIREMEISEAEMKDEYGILIHYGPRYNYSTLGEEFPIPMSVDAYCKPEDIAKTKIEMSIKAQSILYTRIEQLQQTFNLLNDSNKIRERDKPKVF